MSSEEASEIRHSSPEDDSWVHLGDKEHHIKESEDIGSWYRNVQFRLKDFPESPTNYQTMLNTIQQLQILFDVVDKKKSALETQQSKLPFSFDDLCRTLSIRQDRLFKLLVPYQKKELEGIQMRLTEVENTLEQELEDNYQLIQRYIDSQQEVRQEIDSCHTSLQVILDAPQPARQASFVQQQVQQIDKDAPGLKSQVSRESESIRHKAMTQQLFCQDLERRLDDRMEKLEEGQEKKRKEILCELGEVEQWLNGFYSHLCQEPVRDTEGGVYGQGIGEPVEAEESQDLRFGYDSSEDPLLSDSGSSVGAEPIALLETSVDADLEDTEYMEQVTQRVFSPVDETNDGPEVVVEGEADLDAVLGSPLVQQKSTDLDAVLGSPLVQQKSTDLDAVFGSPLVQQKSTDLDAVIGTTVMIDLDGPERSLESDVDVDTMIDAESTGSGSTVQAGRKLGGDKAQDGVPIESESADVEISGGYKEERDSSGEEGSGSYEENDGSEWSEGVELVPMTHDPTLHQLLPHTTTHSPAENIDITTLLQTLQTAQENLPAQEVRVHEALTNVATILSSSDQEEELKRRVDWVKSAWDHVAHKLTVRLAQLQFEKHQQDVRDSILDARQVCDAQPNVLVPEKELPLSIEALTDYFESGDFDSIREQLLLDLRNSLTQLEEVRPRGTVSGEYRKVVDRLTQAYDAVTDKVGQKKVFLEASLSLWSSFNRGCDQLSDWLDHVEELVAKETYGYDITETEEYYNTIKALKEQLPSHEKHFAELFEEGGALMSKMADGDEAVQSVDQQLSSFEQRYTELVTQDTGKIDTLESDLKKVKNDWKTFNQMYEGARAFINQMTKMVGPEPLESSNGDSTLLTTYMTYNSQLSSMEVQYNRLVAAGERLSSNEKIGNREGIKSDLTQLQVKWHPLRDNIRDSLKLLISEYNDWMMMKLQKMAGIVIQAEELVSHKIHFVENFPLTGLFDKNASELLKEADALVASQEQLDQLENDCTNIEEDLLQRQVQQESNTGMRESASSLELPATVEEKARLQRSRLKLQTTSDALQPIFNVFYLQLQLLQSIQEGKEMVVKATESVGEQVELKELLSDLEVKLSTDFFEGLSAEAFDLGAVAENCEHTMEDMGEQQDFTLPPYQEIATVNRRLMDEVESLNAATDEAKMRLSLFIQWWAEYRDNRDDLCPWLETGETRLQQLVARAESTQPPLVSPAELLIDVQELQSECEDKQVLLSALTSTSSNIVDEMTSKGSPPSEITDQVTDIQQRFRVFYQGVEARVKLLSEEATQFESFLSQLEHFSNWVNEFHATLYDEVCVRVQAKASEEVISRHKNILEKYKQVMSTRVPEYNGLLSDSEQWGDHLVPDETAGNLPSPSEPSPPPLAVDDDFVAQVPLPYVKKRVNSVTKKWNKIHQLIVERENQLEISGGTIQSFFESLRQLTSWIEGRQQLEVLARPPPANLGDLNECSQQLKELEREMEDKVVSIESLTQSVGVLKQSLSGPNIKMVEQRMADVNEGLDKLETDKNNREKVCQALVPRIKSFLVSYTSLNEWLEQREATFTDCGPIGANLPRLEEQSEILKTLDEELLEKKREPEELVKEAASLLKGTLESSGTDITSKSEDIDARFVSLSQSSAERLEQCEEALSAMQEFQGKVNNFLKWLEKVEKSLTDITATKKPIGSIQLQLDDFYDFMRDIETHTEDYLCLCPEAGQLSQDYKPSDMLDQMMKKLAERWTQYVEALTKKSEELRGLMTQWNRYESEVKGLLDWITEEANTFSKKVTTKGDEGVEDYIEACKVFTETMSEKKESIGCIEDLAEKLREVDGVKKNGTSDVDSRMNDVNQHWSSLVKLLSETLLHLESTHAEVRHVIRIRREELGWLEDCELAAADRVSTEGEITVIQQEIETHKQCFAEIQGHQKECEFIERTVVFLVEHSRKENRAPLRTEAEDFCTRYHTLLASEDTYIHNLENSIPYWENFKTQSQELAEWIDMAKEELMSDRVASGNASVTKTSLENVQNLLLDSRSKKQMLNTTVCVGGELQELVVPGDQQYVADTLECLEQGCREVEDRTQNLVTLLDERLTSWQVFPVEEARVVQEFLDNVTNVVEEELDEQEFSTEQLEDKIQQLELLQKTQQSNEQKIFAIEQSAESEDIKKALQKNPDISKERNNLLQGWSSMSSSLRDKISSMKAKAAMVRQLEELCLSCETNLKVYQNHLQGPLPSSVLLESTHTKVRKASEQLHNSCQSTLTSFRSALQKYDSSNSQFLAVPERFRAKAKECSEQFTQLSTRAEEWRKDIEGTLVSWGLFKEHLTNLSKWCKDAFSELATLKSIQNFVKDFQSFEDKLQYLTEEKQQLAGKFEYLVEHSPKHCTGETTEVKKVKEQFVKLEKSWQAISEGLESLTEVAGPWKELTELFDKLTNSHERLNEMVERAFDIVRERDGGNLSDIIHQLKDNLNLLVDLAPHFQKLHQLDDKLLTPQTCKKSKEARGLKEDCSRIEDNVEHLKERVRTKLSELERKEKEWKALASKSIERVSLLEHQLAENKQRATEAQRVLLAQKEEVELDNRDKDKRIKQLERTGAVQPAVSTSSCSLFCRWTIYFLILLFTILAVVFTYIYGFKTNSRKVSVM